MLKAITLPASVKTVESNAFANTGLTDITIPAGAVKGTSGKVNDEIVVKVTGAALELKPVSTTPADGDVMKTFYNITLNFNTRVSMVAGIMPTFTKDSPTGTDLADQWNGSAGTNSVTYWIEDLDGYVDPKTLDAGATYYITIPAGAIKNDAGTTTDEIVITIKGEQPFLTVVSTTPASGTEATEFTDLEVNFGETVTVDRDLSAAIHKGSKDGEVVNAYWGVRAITDGIIVYTLDEYYEGPEAVPFEPGNKYYVVIPAGIAKNAAGAINDEIVVEFVCPAAPLEFVSSTPADGEVVVEAFSTITRQQVDQCHCTGYGLLRYYCHSREESDLHLHRSRWYNQQCCRWHQ